MIEAYALKAFEDIEFKVVQEALFLKLNEMEQAIAKVESLEATKSTEYARITKLSLQMEILEEAFVEAHIELDDIEKRNYVILPIITMLKFDLKIDLQIANEGNMEHCQSIFREALLKFNEIERKITFHQKKVDGYQMRVKTGEDLYYKTSKDFKNIDVQILKSKEIVIHYKANYHSLSI